MTTSLTTTDMPTSTGTPSTMTISPPTTGPNSPTTGQTSTVTEAPVLSVFDYASIGVGLLALSLHYWLPLKMMDIPILMATVKQV